MEPRRWLFAKACFGTLIFGVLAIALIFAAGMMAASKGWVSAFLLFSGAAAFYASVSSSSTGFLYYIAFFARDDPLDKLRRLFK